MERPLELPERFQSRLQTLLGEEAPAFVESLANGAPAGLRTNTLKLLPERLAELAPFDLQPLPGVREAFLVEGEAQPGRHPYHAAGLYYLQDPSAMLAAQLLAPQPGERVLDLSAAPGGKTTHLAALMSDQGLLVANEIDSQRVWVLAENLERWGAHSAVITNETPSHLADHFPGFFDRVLLDAPCSGEGMFWKSAAARQQWSPALVQSCALRQASILAEAARMLKPGGRLAYITCTFAPEENEAVVLDFLHHHPGFHLVDLPRLPGFSPGMPGWVSRPASSATPPEELEKAVRLWPHRWPGGGQFIAVLQKGGGLPAADAPPSLAPARLPPLSKEARAQFSAFADQALSHPIPAERLLRTGDQLYLLPPELPDLGRLRVIRRGLWLGTFKKDRFEPAHALALSLPAGAARLQLDLSADDPVVYGYLRGETLPNIGPQGWVLVSVDGFGLGWGKQVGERVKNHYPRGLRRP